MRKEAIGEPEKFYLQSFSGEYKKACIYFNIKIITRLARFTYEKINPSSLNIRAKPYSEITCLRFLALRHVVTPSPVKLKIVLRLSKSSFSHARLFICGK